MGYGHLGLPAASTTDFDRVSAETKKKKMLHVDNWYRIKTFPAETVEVLSHC